MSTLNKSLTKSDCGKEATRKKRQLKGLLNISGRVALSQMKSKLITKELKKSKITERDIDIAYRLHKQYPDVFFIDPETTRRRISLVRSRAGRNKRSNIFDKEQVINECKKVIANNPNVHNISCLVDWLRNQSLPNYSVSYLSGIIGNLKRMGDIK